MLERVVGRMFRSATRGEQQPSSPEKISSSSSGSSDKSSPSKASGDIEIDNSTHVLVKIATLYAERLMNDICLMVGGTEYPAHRLILCASSEVFQVMLMNPRWSESHESRVVLQETPACAAVFGEFLRYFYTGQIRINHLTIMPVLALADKYNVKDLTTLCVQYMCNHIAHAATHNQLISWFQYTLSLGHYQVAQACQNFVKWNLEMVAETSDFGNFHHEILARLLKHNDIVVHNEMTVYNCVVHWLELQRQQLMQEVESEQQLEMQMEALVQEVMANVRFPMMTPRQLAELLLSPLTKQYKEFFIERMAIGMSFHSGHTQRVQEVTEAEGGLLFTPRLYTADKWSSLLAIENFNQLAPYHTRTLVFMSHAVFAEYAGEKTCEWIIDLHPKGVWFRKFYLIIWQGTVEVPESVLSTVRVSLTCKDPPSDGEDLRVKVGILITGIQDGVEHIMSVIQRNHRFSENDKVLNLDDILAFDELNENLIDTKGEKRPSSYLVGANRDVLKIHVVIAPLSEVSSVDSQDIDLIVPTR